MAGRALALQGGFSHSGPRQDPRAGRLKNESKEAWGGPIVSNAKQSCVSAHQDVPAALEHIHPPAGFDPKPHHAKPHQPDTLDF